MTEIHTAVVRADEFMRVTSNALLFAGKDDTLPALVAVHYRPAWDGSGWLMAEATNRYVASQELIETHDREHVGHTDADHDGPCPAAAETTLNILINAKDVAKLIKTLKLVTDDGKGQPHWHQPHVLIEHEEGTTKVRFTLLLNSQEVSVTQDTLMGEFPRVDGLISGAMLPPEELAAKLAKDAERPGHVSAPVPDVWEREYIFNPDYLALFTKVVTSDREYAGLKLSFSASGKPAAVHIGVHFRGIIVPIRKAE